MKAAKSLHAQGQGDAMLHHLGTACECLLKAKIMSIEGMNRWPDRSDRPQVYTHNLKILADIANVSISTNDDVAPSWAVLMHWDRLSSYNPNEMPKRVRDGWFDAAFGENGVLEWLM